MGRPEDCGHCEVASPKRSWKGLISLLILGAALVWVVISTVQERGREREAAVTELGQVMKAPVAAGVGSTAPPFRLITLENQTLTLDDFRGRPVAVSFFASWCDSCKEELPLVKELAARGGVKGYSVLGVAMRDRQEDLTRFVQAEGISFPSAVDVDSHVARAFRVIAPPATIFIDSQGVIRHIVMGPLTPEQAQEGLERAGARLDTGTAPTPKGDDRS